VPERQAEPEVAGEQDEERPGRRLSSRVSLALSVAAFLVALFVLRQVFMPLARGNQFYLVIFLGAVLPLVFVGYRGTRRPGATGPTDATGPTGSIDADDPGPLDYGLAALALLVGLYPVLVGFDDFLDRQGSLSTVDVVAGALLLMLVLEACRRTTGPVLPAVCLGFLGYAYYGGYLPQDWSIAHAGIDFSQIVNALYNDQSGFYGTPLDVAATYIVLFTIYGAVLNASGAGRFFVDLSFAVFRRSATAPGRTTALSGFLLGTVSGSGTATTVSLGAVTWPVLRRAGYPRENAGGLLAASGIGAILSPPTLGAAAFIIAEYLNTSYFDVLLWACLPTLLYYLGIALAVEADARRFGARPVDLDGRPSPWRLLAHGGHHLISLGIIVVFLARGIPPFRAVVYATAVAAAFALVAAVLAGRDGPVAAVRGWLRAMAGALAAGVRGVLPVVAVCAAAGVITSTITKTGLGQVLSASLVGAARALSSNPTLVLLVTVVFAAVAICAIGLAVPVTASFIIAWVVIGPALAALGVDDAQRAMFIFYYAVLSEVTPPTALAAVAAAAVTGGDVVRTMWQTWRYTLPAFCVPIAVVLTDNGAGLLLERPAGTVLWALAASAAGVAALAAVSAGWLPGRGQVGRFERALCVPAAALLLYLQPWAVAAGAAVLTLAVATSVIRSAVRRKANSAADESQSQQSTKHQVHSRQKHNYHVDP
jgi:TRAP transporter 4TM/12TM fusion protein